MHYLPGKGQYTSSSKERARDVACRLWTMFPDEEMKKTLSADAGMTATYLHDLPLLNRNVQRESYLRISYITKYASDIFVF